MTHPIVEGLTEAITMAKLMRENEELRADVTAWMNACNIAANDLLVAKSQLAEWQQREASTANAFIQAQADLKSAHDALAEEKALADQADAIILKIINGPQVECIPDNDIQADIAAYRKARGM